jgi:NAD(P)-dependent dehydrogenase (short-subunit alcohol dehydrogenase family)
VAAFAARGWTVFAGVRRAEDGRRLVGENPGRTVVPVTLDVTDAAQVRGAMETIQAHPDARGGLGALVNNAGQFFFGAAEVLEIAEWRKQFEINVFGTIDVTQVFLPLVRRAGGRVINISSIGGLVSQPLCGAYTASKFALEAASDALRIEIAATGVKVVLIEPGAVRTPIFDKAMNASQATLDSMPAQHRDRYVPALLQFKRTGERFLRSATTPEHAADVIFRAATRRRPRARYLVGKDALMLAMMKRLLPTSWLDCIFRRMAGLHKSTVDTSGSAIPGTATVAG